MFELTKLYTLKEVSEIVQMNIITIYRHRKEAKLKTVKIGGEYRVTEEQLQEYLKGE